MMKILTLSVTVTYMYICTQTNTHTEVQWMEYTSCRQYPHFSIQMYKFKHCNKSLSVYL